jgi:hypothetical protein
MIFPPCRIRVQCSVHDAEKQAVSSAALHHGGALPGAPQSVSCGESAIRHGRPCAEIVQV